MHPRGMSTSCHGKEDVSMLAGPTVCGCCIFKKIDSVKM